MCYHKFCIADVQQYHDLNLDFNDVDSSLDVIFEPQQTVRQNNPIAADIDDDESDDQGGNPANKSDFDM